MEPASIERATDSSQIQPLSHDAITCSLCLDKFKDPRLLPCFHTYCKACLDELVQANRGSGNFACPLCRSSQPIQNTGGNDFPQNFYMNALMQAILNKGELCNICNEKDKIAERKCLDCDQNLCHLCFEYHLKLAVTKSHRVISLSSEDRRMVKASYCLKHKSEVLRFFCKQCRESVCRDCKLTIHEGHPSVDLTDVSEAASQSLTDLERQYNFNLQELSESVQYLDSYEERMESIGRDIGKTIQMHVEKICEQVRDSGKRLQEDVKSQLSCKVKSVHEKRQEIQKRMRSCKQIVEHIGQVKQLGSTADIISTRDSINRDNFGDTTALDLLEDSMHPEWKKPRPFKIDLGKHAQVPFGQITWIKSYEYLQANTILSFRSCLSSVQKVISICPVSNGMAWIVFGNLHGFKLNRKSNVLKFSDTGVCNENLHLPEIRDITCTKTDDSEIVYYDRWTKSLVVRDIKSIAHENIEDGDKKGKKYKNGSQDDKQIVGTIKEVISLTRNGNARVAVLCANKTASVLSLENSSKVIQTKILSKLDRPTRISYNVNGYYCISDIGREKVVLFDENFEFKAELEISPPPNRCLKEHFLPGDVCCDSKGSIFVSDFRNNCVLKFDLDLNHVSTVSCSILKTETKFHNPSSLAIDSKNRLWVADDNDRLSILHI